jgi:hypothetical protein
MCTVMEIRLPTKAELEELFTSRQLPGWLLQIIGGLVVLRWLLDLKSTLEEAVTTIGQVPAVIRLLSPLIFSPWFGIALVLVGIAYVIFIPAKDRPSPHAKVAVFVAWAGFVLCSLAIWTVLTAAFTVGGPRHLTEKQERKFTHALVEGPDISSQISIITYSDCFECRAYAWDFAIAMNTIQKWKWKNIGVLPYPAQLSTLWRGVIIGARPRPSKPK